MPDKFQPDDRVFAKIKGWPPWPAKVLNRVEGKGEAYMILFYGTYDTSVVKPDSMYVYGDDSKAKYGKHKNSNRWKEAMEEIENNTPICETGPLEEAPPEVKPMEADNDTDGDGDGDGDGELMIDEGPQPPVLIKEVSKAPVSTSSENGKSEQPKPPARRGSKASLSKRDSISSNSSATDVSTPTGATAATPSGTELVSRSGRKIKPKRFADDEISTPTPTKNKNSSQDDSIEGPPTKRAKRGGKTPPSAGKTTPVPEPREPPPIVVTRPRMVIGKGRGAPPKTSPASGRISPDINAMVPKAPALKPAASGLPQRKSDAPMPPQAAKKPLPALIPAAASAVAIQQQAAAAVMPPTRRAPSLRQQARQDVITDEESENEGPPILAMGVDETETDDKENLKDGAPSSNDSEMESESEMEKASEMDETSSRYSDHNDESLMRLRFTDKEGEQFEMRIETKETFESEEEQKEYDNTLQTIVKLKEDLEQGDQETHETIQELLEVNKDDFDQQEAHDRERRGLQIRTLRVEGEVIEIIGEIVSCLGERQAEVARAYELLDRLGTHELTALILKKHPEVVHTVSRLRNYVGNVEQWDMTEEQVLDFKEGAQMIRIKASEIYSSFYDVFIAPEEQDETVAFEDIFKEEMKVFKEQTSDFTMDEILGLTAENENGGFEIFDVGDIEA